LRQGEASGSAQTGGPSSQSNTKAKAAKSAKSSTTPVSGAKAFATPT